MHHCLVERQYFCYFNEGVLKHCRVMFLRLIFEVKIPFVALRILIQATYACCISPSQSSGYSPKPRYSKKEWNSGMGSLGLLP